ncbi:hypothetical protein AYI69_g10876 [Smittium culicis]|uniref:Uncharacterized protein n=1 Tax=Smittium culicis TaxID=133412 RepID=A0A1R1X2S6_9FUNG|nr:hypothetical protein AYI69_g10876 [Smittium culicis]
MKIRKNSESQSTDIVAIANLSTGNAEYDTDLRILKDQKYYIIIGANAQIDVFKTHEIEENLKKRALLVLESGAGTTAVYQPPLGKTINYTEG